MEENKNIDWQRRFEIAKEIFRHFIEVDIDAPEEYAWDTVRHTDALIAELRKPKEQDKFSRIVELAPEMYKALESIVKASESFPLTRQGFVNYYKETKSIAQEAIDKCNVDYPEIE